MILKSRAFGRNEYVGRPGGCPRSGSIDRVAGGSDLPLDMALAAAGACVPYLCGYAGCADFGLYVTTQLSECDRHAPTTKAKREIMHSRRPTKQRIWNPGLFRLYIIRCQKTTETDLLPTNPFPQSSIQVANILDPNVTSTVINSTSTTLIRIRVVPILYVAHFVSAHPGFRNHL